MIDTFYIIHLKIILLTVKKVLLRSDLVEAGCQGSFDEYRKKQWADGVVPYPEDTEEGIF